MKADFGGFDESFELKALDGEIEIEIETWRQFWSLQQNPSLEAVEFAADSIEHR